MVHFAKYHGAGNDFVVIDDREQTFPLQVPGQIASLCHRRCGIGADGLILLQPSTSADYRMRIFNADGSEPSMCGNGIRCLVAFIRRLGCVKQELTIETGSGVLSCRWEGEKIHVRLGVPQGVELCEVGMHKVHVVNTGVPHAVFFVEDVEQVDLSRIGPEIRHHVLFMPHGVNVNVACVLEGGDLCVRTYERGVEAETLACGTGVAAVAWVAQQLFEMPEVVRVRTRGGGAEPEIAVRVSSAELELIGSATFVFEGALAFSAGLTPRRFS